jgi:hypothetical protein
MLAFSIAFLILVYSQKAGHQALLNQYAKNKGTQNIHQIIDQLAYLAASAKFLQVY